MLGSVNLDKLAQALRDGRGPQPRAREDALLSGPGDWAHIAFDHKPSGVWYVVPHPKPAWSPEEADEQARLFSWLRGPDAREAGLLAHSVPNDGAGSAERMVALKRVGLTPGVCDLYVFGRAGNLAIEMKRAAGKASDLDPKQLAWLEGLAPLPSWTACTCWGYEAARAAIQKFLHVG